MEILKAAAQQQMDTYSTQNAQSQFNAQTREVEN